MLMASTRQRALKWLGWIPRLFAPRRNRKLGEPGLMHTGERPGVYGARTVGRCEACGAVLTVRSRRAAFRGRVDCKCGHRNHVQFRIVREAIGRASKHVSITARRQFELAGRNPDLRLPFRYGLCPHCVHAVRLVDAHVISRANINGSVETSAYYCDTCRVHDDVRRGRLLGHDRHPVVDTLCFV
jgi:hypothetical protein